MKIKVIFFLLLSVNLQSFSQDGIYYQAKYLMEQYSPVTSKFTVDDNVAGSLQNIFPTKTTDEIIVKLNANPLVAGLFTKQAGAAAESFTPPAYKSLNRLDVTTVVDGLAKFIVERTKKELTAAYFDRFIKELKKPDYKDAQTLFPSTWGVVLTMPDKVFNYQLYLQSLRTSFIKDLDNILPNVEMVIRDGRFKAFFTANPELRSICLTALHFGKGLKNGTHIGKLIEDYNPVNSDYSLGSAADVARINGIKFIKELSTSLKSITPSGKQYWINKEEVNELLEDRMLLKAYMALLSFKVETLVLSQGSAVTYGSAITSLSADVTAFEELLESLSTQIETLQNVIDEVDAKSRAEKTIDQLVAYFNASTNVIENFSENAFIKKILIDNGSIDLTGFWNSYGKITETTNSFLTIYTSIKEKNYSVAISNVKHLYEQRYKPELASNASVRGKVNDVIRFLLDKGAFIATVAEAKNSDDVQKAIESVAMPSGSARVKRLSRFNVALNAYCGLFTGFEKIRQVDKDFEINSYGLAAPIGISLSLGTKKGWSHTLMLTAIDIGTVAAFRFANDTTAEIPTIQLGDIVSPGLIYSLGIPRSPLSVNLGVQVGPNLRKVTSTTNDYSNNAYMRFSLAFVVDIPIFNFYTKTR